ncbi:response regulator [Aneurinibacillus sp. REN35]|uniref:response regulator n=1 Tax=Aneurinibacillus sp. REN35 TaxID=3237286 RepID=UPI0035273420
MGKETIEQIFRKKYYAQLCEVTSRITQPERLAKDEKWRQEIYRILHSLKGTAGTLGYHSLSHIAETGLSMFTDTDDYILPNYMVSPMYALIREAMDLLRSTEHAYVSEGIIQELQAFNKEDEKPKRILIIDDDEALLASIHQVLSLAGFDVEVLSDASTGLDEMLNKQPDCIILDVMMPELNGFNVMRRIRSDTQRQFTPVLFLTAKSDIEDKYKGFQLGADEYLTKPFQFEELMLRIKTLISRVETYRSLSMRDALTGLYNRRYLIERLQELFVSYARKPSDISLAIMDLDYFKRVNDTYGHPCGDTVLKSFASFLKSRLREVDIITRYGGEEFIVILPDTNVEQARTILNRMREEFGRHEIECDDARIFQTFSGGIAQLGKEGDDIPKLIQQADQALYLAKFKGRNRLCLASEVEAAGEEAMRKKVLIADDDLIVHSILEHQLEDTGWELHFANDGHEVLDLVDNVTPDMFILDGIMPGMTGLEICEALRKQPRFAKTPIIMLTGRSGEDDVAMALDTGVDDYVVKPFSPIELKARMNRLFVRMK